MRCSALGTRFFAVTILGLALGAFMAAGCGGSSGGAAAPGGETSAVDLKSLSTVPTVDLSQYDSSQASTGSASISAARSVHVAKEFSTHGSGMSSRAGCETNMHKKEIFRMAQQIQMDRCMPEALQKAGVIPELTDNSLLYLAITKPPESETDRSRKCAGIPASHTEERAACEAEGDGGKSMKVRLGISDNKLHVDMCKGGESPSLISESTYSKSDGTATADVVRIGNWNGKNDASHITISATGITAITDGIPTLSDTGTVTASAILQGGNGDGLINYTFDNSNSSNTLAGKFHGGFTDPVSGSTNDFTGSVYAQWDSTMGCAQFGFTGTQPPMPLKNMIPFDVQRTPAVLTEFLRAISSTMGIDVTASNYATLLVCPNPDPAFDPKNPGNTPPMVAATLTGSVYSCGEVSHSGVECFSIANGSSTDDFGGDDIAQTFTFKDSTDVPFYAAVNAFDLSTLTTDGAVAFSAGAWDCTAPDGFTEVSMETITPAQIAVIEASMQACSSLERRARDQGMGGYNCGGQEVGNAVGEMQDHPPEFGDFGGELELQEGQCVGLPVPHRLFINPVNPASNQYCLPMNELCSDFTVSGLAATFTPAVSLPGDGGMTITAVTFDATPATTATFTFSTDEGGGPCIYDRHKPELQAHGEGEGPEPTDFPDACKAKGFTDPKQCQEFCMSHGEECFPGGH